MTAADQVIQNAAGKFDTPAQAIIKRCAQSGVHLRMDGESLKAKGNRETIASWQPMIQRHKPEIIAALSGQPHAAAANEHLTLGADYSELSACIIELCQIVNYSDEARERMLSAMGNLYPFQYAEEAAYFRLQVARAKAGKYWDGNAPLDTHEHITAHPRRAA